MSFNHEAVAALPVSTGADKALIRAMATRRFAYGLAASESATDWIAADPATGVVPLYALQNNILFQYDAADSTTAHDGVTCLVSNDGKRFKSETIAPPYSVATQGTTAQPASPAVGDAYLIPTAATGTDWAGKDAQVGIYTAAGWRFAVVPIGRFLYVKDETAFYHRNTSGVWTAGVGSLVLAANSVPITSVIGANASFVVKVENQTTNAPPASPTVPTAYIVGPSPTGSWSGHTGKLAICNVAGTFTIVTPAAGDQVYDKTEEVFFKFNGTDWIPATNAVTRSNAVTYNVTAADDGTTISLYGGAFQAILFPAGSTLPEGFRCWIHNEETTAVGKGVGGTNLGSFTMYPSQSYEIQNINDVVTALGGLKPYMIESIQLYCHGSNGSDDPLVADGLADSTRAYATEGGLKTALWSNFLHLGSQAFCTLTGNFTEHLDFSHMPAGCSVIWWVGSAPNAYISNYASGGSNWTLGDGVVMIYGNVTFEAGGASVTAIQHHQNVIGDMNSGVQFNNYGAGVHLGTDGAGWTINILAGYTVHTGGNCNTHLGIVGGGVVNITGGITITINGTPAPVITNWITTAGPSLINYGGGVTFSGTPATGCKQWTVAQQSWLSTSGNTIPGSVAGTPAGNLAPAAGTGWVS